MAKSTQGLNQQGGAIQVDRLEDGDYWVEQRCAEQPNGAIYCELYDGYRQQICETIGCNSKATPGSRYCTYCGSKDYPYC